MKNVINEIKSSFIKELEAEGDLWRLFRRRTFVDLIKFHFIKYQKEQKEEDLIAIINLALKVKILTHLKEIKLANTLDETLNKFNKESYSIIKVYNYLIDEISSEEDNFTGKDLYDLNKEINYLKIVNQIDEADYSDEVLDNLIYSALNVLKKNF